MGNTGFEKAFINRTNAGNGITVWNWPVSYTHLDVYKRQGLPHGCGGQQRIPQAEKRDGVHPLL